MATTENDGSDGEDNHRAEDEQLALPLITDSEGTFLSDVTQRNNKDGFYRFAFVLFGVLGTVPWNFFINANEFWEYKFREINSSNFHRDFGERDHDGEAATHRSDLQRKFESFLSIASMVPGLIGAVAGALLNTRFRTHYRMLVPMVIVVLLFFTVTAISEFNTDSWQLAYLAVTLSIVAVMNGFNSYGQCSTMGFAGTINPKFMNAMMSGQAVGGVFASLARIATVFIKNSNSSRYYFLSGLLIIMLTIVTFFILSRTIFYKFHLHKIEDNRCLINEVSFATKRSVWSILGEIKLYVFSILIIFITTLAIFPSVASLIISVDVKADSLWTGKLFIPVACFLVFNVGDLCGRCLANWVQLIPERNISLLFISVFRMIFIPLLMLCNAQPRNYLPVIINTDWEFIILMTVFAVTNGYLATICMMFAPKLFDDVGEQELASVLMSLFMATGIALGAICSTFLVILL